MKFEKTDLKNRVNRFVPYLATFYYVEIIYLMIFLNFIYGKVIAVSAGLLLTFFLTFHVLRLFYKKDINRKIQLYFMDIHIAYSAAYFVNMIVLSGDYLQAGSFLAFFRIITACIETVSVIILTDTVIRREYID